MLGRGRDVRYSTVLLYGWVFSGGTYGAAGSGAFPIDRKLGRETGVWLEHTHKPF